MNTTGSGSKGSFIRAYFEEWNGDLLRSKELLLDGTHYLEGIIVLSCYIGALASLRHPDLPDNEAYKKIVLQYSGMKDFYEEIDLLFFLQWPRSELSRHGSFLALKNHPEISAVIIDTFGNEDTVRGGSRYVKQQQILDAVAAKPFPKFDSHNLTKYLPLFSNCELLYRYVRCHAVHNRSFPFVTRVHSSGKQIRYENNHAITGDVLFQTAKGILDELKDECLKNGEWPWAL